MDTIPHYCTVKTNDPTKTCLICGKVNNPLSQEAKGGEKKYGKWNNHPIHPEYGACDAFADGECDECRKVFSSQQSRIEELKGEKERLQNVASELLEVAQLRGDNVLPHPADSDKHWTARMQCAWNELEEVLASLEK